MMRSGATVIVLEKSAEYRMRWEMTLQSMVLCAGNEWCRPFWRAWQHHIVVLDPAQNGGVILNSPFRWVRNLISFIQLISVDLSD